MQQCGDEGNAHSLADMSLAPEKVGCQRRLAVAGCKRMQRAEPEGQPKRAGATSTQVRGQRAHNAALDLTEPSDQPVGHDMLHAATAALIAAVMSLYAS